MRVAVVAMAVVAALIGAGCTVPGEPYSYVDVRVATPLASSVAWPTAGQGFTLSARVRNAWKRTLDVPWELRELDPATPDDLTSGSVVASGTLAVPAFGEATVSAALAPADGPHRYALRLDPAGALAERYETNNTSVLAVGPSDLDLVFATPAPAIVTPVPAAPALLQLRLAVLNQANPAAVAAPATDVNFVITIDDGTPVMPTAIEYGDPSVALGNPANPVPVASGATVPVLITLPRPSAGPHTYTIGIQSSVAEQVADEAIAIVIIPAAG